MDLTVIVDPSEIDGMINLDLDLHGRVLGIEVLDASKKLPMEMLRQMGRDTIRSRILSGTCAHFAA